MIYPTRISCNGPAHVRFALLIALLVIGESSGVDRVTAGTVSAPFVKIVDVIPESLSGENDFNVEPYLAVNPANRSEMAASAWTTEPLGGGTTPVFISMDGGESWSCRSTVPGIPQTADKTLQFSGLSNMLYLATCITNPAKDYDLMVWRSDRLAKSLLVSAEHRPGVMDQPFATAATMNKKDRVFVGYFNWNGSKGKTAIIDRSLDGTGNPPGSDFTPISIDFDDPLFDSSEIRPAISNDGKKVYAAFNRVTSVDGNKRVGDVVLVRDDDGGNSGTKSFEALRDPNGVPGFTVVKKRTFLFDGDGYAALLANDRLGGDLAIAVDPNHADIVYLVWGNCINDQPVLHLVRGEKGGTVWSTKDLRTVVNAKNPGLAVNDNGTVAFLYQQVTSDSHRRETWNTQLELAKNDFKDVTVVALAKFPAAELTCVRGQPRVGDYLHLTAMGHDFYGIFSSSNFPDTDRFPCQATSQCQVTFQRKADFNAKRLLDQDGNEVQSSIDPFFFKVSGR